MAEEVVNIRVTDNGSSRVVQRNIEGIGTSASGALSAVKLLAAGIAGLGILQVTRQAIGFESAMVGVQKTTGLSDKAIKGLGQEFRKLALVIPVSATELAKIGEIAGQLGIQGVENIKAFTDTVAKVASTTDFTVDAAASDLARLSVLFSLPIKEVDKLASSMNALENSTTANAPTIAEFSKRMAGAATTIGLTAAEVNAVSATLDTLGAQAEAGSSVMTKAFSNMVSDAEGFGEVMGLTASEFRKSLERDAIGTVQAFLTSLGDLDKEVAVAALDDLGLQGVRALPIFLKLKDNTALLERNVRTSSEAFREGTSIQEEFATQVKSTENQIKLLKNQVNEMALQLGDGFLPVLNKAITDLNKFMNNGQESSTFLRDVGAFFATIAVTIPKAFLGAVNLVSTAFIQLEIIINKGLLKILEAFNDVFDTTNIQNTFKTTIKDLENEMEGFRENWVVSFGEIAEAWTTFFDGVGKPGKSAESPKKVIDDTAKSVENITKKFFSMKDALRSLNGETFGGLSLDEITAIQEASAAINESFFGQGNTGQLPRQDDENSPLQFFKAENLQKSVTEAKRLEESIKNINNEITNFSGKQAESDLIKALFQGKEGIALNFGNIIGDINTATLTLEDLETTIENLEAAGLDPQKVFPNLIPTLELIQQNAKATGASFKEAFGEQAQEEIRNLNEEVKALEFFDSPIQKLDQMEAAIRRVGEQFNKSSIEIESAVSRLRDASDPTVAAIERIGRGIESSMTKTFADAARGVDSFKDTFKQVIDQILEQIVRLSIVRPFIDSLFGDPGKKGDAGGLFGSLLTGIIGAFAGPTVGPGPSAAIGANQAVAASLTGFAHGGQFTVGGSGGTDSQFVNFKATPGEEVTIRTPEQQKQNSGPNVTIVQHFNLGVADTVRAEFENLRPQILDDTQSAMARAMDRGGHFANQFQ